MKDEILLFFYYNKINVESYINKINSEPPKLGVSVYQTIDYIPLYGTENIIVGNIQFNNINKQYITYPPLYNVSENIQIQLNNNTSISFINYYKSNTEFYPNNSKFILPIVSCTGIYAGKKGFVVIDIINDNRFITIKLE